MRRGAAVAGAVVALGAVVGAAVGLGAVVGAGVARGAVVGVEVASSPQPGTATVNRSKLSRATTAFTEMNFTYFTIVLTFMKSLLSDEFRRTIE